MAQQTTTALPETIPGNPKKRVVFIDQARALAITLMLFGHSADRFLAEPWRSGPFWTNYQFFRGVSSALFLFIAGFSFAVASLGHFSDYTNPSPRFWRRIRRIGLILFLGYLLQLYGPTLSRSIALYSPERWERLVRFDVLQNIGFGLLLLHGIVMVARRLERFPWLAGTVALLIFAVAPLTYQQDVDGQLPVALSSALNLYHQSRFPLVPFTGYLVLGSIAGYAYVRLRALGKQHLVFRGMLLFAAVLTAFDLLTRGTATLFPYSNAAANMPGYTFARLGIAMAFVVALFHLERVLPLFPRIAYLLGSESLAIYFVHLFLVYGSQTVPGALSGYAQGMGPFFLALWVGALWVSMLGMAYLITALRKNADRPRLVVKHCALASVASCFILANDLQLLSITVITFISTAITVLGHTWFRRRALS